MNIVYGVSGEGLGHVFEAIEIAGVLRSDGHNVKVLTYGDRACRSLASLNPTRIEGVHLQLTPKGLSLAKTVRKNFRCVPFYIRNWGRLRREVAGFKPDVFITAYEPVTTILAHRLKRPLISMDNQNELRHMSRPPGASPFAFHLAVLATRVVTYGADAYIVKSLARQITGDSRVHPVSPIIQAEIQRQKPTVQAHVLVYLTKPNPALIDVLKTLPETFIVYCHNQVGTDGNITYRAQGESFPRDLASCKAVIGTTGFSLIADSIYLRKPYFGVPLGRQFEQIHNANFLRDSGLGDYADAATRGQLEEFLARLPDYRARLERHGFDPTEQAETLRRLLAELGGRSEFPAPHRKEGGPVGVQGAEKKGESNGLTHENGGAGADPVDEEVA